jgi:hypothetical protein
MPRHPVVNRRSRPTLRRHDLYASEEAVGGITDLAEALHVSKASLTDTALRLLASLPQAEVVELLRTYKHLPDDDAYEYVKRRARPEQEK